jgi:hypothetical protein
MMCPVKVAFRKASRIKSPVNAATKDEQARFRVVRRERKGHALEPLAVKLS